jgi:hypothetical protein
VFLCRSVCELVCLLLAFAVHFLAAALNFVLHWCVAALRCAVCAVSFRAAVVFPASISFAWRCNPAGPCRLCVGGHTVLAPFGRPPPCRLHCAGPSHIHPQAEQHVEGNVRQFLSACRCYSAFSCRSAGIRRLAACLPAQQR